MVLVRDLELGQTGYVRDIDFFVDFEGKVYLGAKVNVNTIPSQTSSYEWYFLQRPYELEKNNHFIVFANMLPDRSRIHLRERTRSSVDVRVFDDLHPNEQKEVEYMNLRSQIIILEKDIRRAVRRENFEKAAWLKKMRDVTKEDLDEICYSTFN